jgi:hypothetical protein
MGVRFMCKALAAAALGIALSLLPAATVACPAGSAALARPQTSTVVDPVGDVILDAPAFQDFVRGQMTRTAHGDFQLVMDLAGPVPLNPQLPPQGHTEIWWCWNFDLDPSRALLGYPNAPGAAAPPEIIVYVSWDGAAFAGTAIDRRPLLAGGEVIITPVQFSINGTRVEAVLPFEVIGDVPQSFPWYLRTIDWSGPLGSSAFFAIDLANSVFGR